MQNYHITVRNNHFGIKKETSFTAKENDNIALLAVQAITKYVIQENYTLMGNPERAPTVDDVSYEMSRCKNIFTKPLNDNAFLITYTYQDNIIGDVTFEGLITKINIGR